MSVMREVDIDAVSLDRLATLLAPERAARLARYVERARELLAGRTIWNVNATAQGGGVAEMLQFLLAYTKGAGVETRWLVLDGTSIVPSLAPVLAGELDPAWLSPPVLTVPDAADTAGPPRAALYAICLTPDDPRCG